MTLHNIMTIAFGVLLASTVVTLTMLAIFYMIGGKQHYEKQPVTKEKTNHESNKD